MVMPPVMARHQAVFVSFSFLFYHVNANNNSMFSSSSSSSSSSSAWDRYDYTPPRQECSIYMAPTSLPGMTGGFGLYTTRDIRQGANILSHADGPSVPVWDPHPSSSTTTTTTSAQLQTFRHTYWWSNGAADFNLMTGLDVFDAQNTLGALPNHHCLLATIGVQLPNVDYDDTATNRFEHAGAGAFSYGQGREFLVQGRDVQAGEELFLSYVPCDKRIEGEFLTQLFQWQHDIPLEHHFRQAARLAQEAWAKLLPEKQVRSTTDKIAWPKRGYSKHVIDLLPRTFGELETIMQQSSSFDNNDVAIQVARHSLQERTVDWIKDNGMCIENVVPLPSVIPQAGMGGVAQFPLQQGEIIVPAPLLHLDRDAVKIHEGSETGTQLLMNYCLGHEESDILLYPDTNAIVLNHCSSRGGFAQYCPDGPNAAFQWSTGWDPLSDEWKNLSVEEIMEHTVRGLSMEVVALRDIQPGEEVFVDYGVAWEEAWESHVAQWNPPERVDPWLTAKEANDVVTIDPTLMTDNLRDITDHPHLFAGCQYRVTNQDYHQDYRMPVDDWDSLSDDEILDLFSDNGEEYEGLDYMTHSDHSHWPCTVLKQETDGSYIVRIHQAWWWKNDEPLPWDDHGLPRLLRRYPREAIHFFVLPYETDQQMARAFRHPIGIPDEIFPEHWKNVQKAASFTSTH